MTAVTVSDVSESPVHDRHRVVAEAQVALVATVFLLVVAAAFGLLAAAGMGAGTVAAAWASTTARRRRDIFVLGDAEFCSRVAIAADGRRRIAGHSVLDNDVELALAAMPEQFPHHDEVVIDGRFLDVVREVAPELIASDRHVLVVPGGQVDAATFRDAMNVGLRSVKRAIDLAGAVVGLLLTIPVLVIAMVAIALDSPGSPIFAQDRLGADGRRFRLYKLRTMRKDNDDSAHQAYVAALIRGVADQHDGMFKLVDDPRVTRVGRFLRKTSLDELPQLWNVLRGEMSLVGPRPPMLNEAALYDDRAWQRLRSKPGLTGLWQVSGRCELSFEDMVDLDVRYYRSWSPLLELQILLKTPRVVLTARGAA